MTLTEIKQSTEPMLTPADVGPAIGVKPQSIRSQARVDPTKLGFKVVVVGSRTLIPRIPFLEWLGEI